jgi:hypothetical protein
MDVPDLSALGAAELPPEMRAAALEEGEVQAGLRCSGCRRRVSHGFRVGSFRTAYVQGRGVIEARFEVVCTEKDCDRLAVLIEGGAVSVEAVRRKFLDEDPALVALLRREPDPAANGGEGA